MIAGYTPVPETSPDANGHRRLLARSINSVLRGKLNAVTTVTLTANTTTTTLTDERINPQSFIGLMPQTANAASALATTYFLAANILNGSVVITHANNAQVDKTFVVLIIG